MRGMWGALSAVVFAVFLAVFTAINMKNDVETSALVVGVVIGAVVTAIMFTLGLVVVLALLHLPRFRNRRAELEIDDKWENNGGDESAIVIVSYPEMQHSPRELTSRL